MLDPVWLWAMWLKAWEDVFLVPILEHHTALMRSIGTMKQRLDEHEKALRKEGIL
jgi:hypothetical protein